MEWNLDLLDLLVHLLCIDLVNELSLLVLRVLHLQCKNCKHEELLLWVSAQVNIVDSSEFLLSCLGIWLFNFWLLLNKLNIDFFKLIAVLGAVAVVSAENSGWRLINGDWLSRLFDERSWLWVSVFFNGHASSSYNHISTVPSQVNFSKSLQLISKVFALLWQWLSNHWLPLLLSKFVRGVNSL